jgi:hypothetical protein
MDSICINQSTDAVPERSHQVELMGEIYKSAVKVVIWLGTSSRKVERVLNQLINLVSSSIDISNLHVEDEATRRARGWRDIGEVEMDIRANVQMALGEKVKYMA